MFLKIDPGFEIIFPFTIEEVLDEEIIFLFSDEWKKE
jgi:hypothetical protein